MLEAAENELVDAADHYESVKPDLRDDFVGEFQHAAARISAFPQHGTPYLRGTRRVVMKRFPFSVVYAEIEDRPVIVAVAHHRRRPGYWAKRLARLRR